MDDEEFLPGLICVAVLVPTGAERSNMAVAVQAPVMRLGADKAIRLLPALQRAAEAIGQIETEGSADSGNTAAGLAESPAS
jgi:DNA-binding IclR family transcriptional regulator